MLMDKYYFNDVKKIFFQSVRMMDTLPLHHIWFTK